MNTMIRFARAAALTVAPMAVLALGAPSVQAQQDPVQAGVAAAVRGDVQLARAYDGTVGRRLDSGAAIFLEDVIAAGPDSGLQIMLMDETVFTIGANSEIVIDDFVYDPETNIGKVSAQIIKGAFRFTTGLVGQEDPDSVSIGTPLGTIGIRGTIVAGLVGADSALIVLIGPGDEAGTKERVGRIAVSNEQGSVDISRGGYGTTLTDGAPPTTPVAVPQTQIDGILSSVQGDAGPAEADDTPSDNADASDDADEDDSEDTADSDATDGETETSDTTSTASDDGASSATSDTSTASEPTSTVPEAGATTETSTTTASLSSTVGGTSVDSLSGATISEAVGGAGSTESVATVSSGTSSAASDATESTLTTLGNLTTLADLSSVTTGTGTINGNGTLSGTNTSGTYSFVGTVNFGSQELGFTMDATWSQTATGGANGDFKLTAGPQSYATIFETTNVVDMFSDPNDSFDSAGSDSDVTFEELTGGDTAQVEIRIRNVGSTVAGAIDTRVTINDTEGGGITVTGEATGTR